MSRLLTGAVLCAIVVMCLGVAVFAEGCCANSASCGAGAASDNTLSKQEQEAGFALLFDGKSFDGWDCTDASFYGWSIKDGVMNLAHDSHGYLYTKKQFTNFELKIDFMVNDHANSGVFFRWADPADPVQTGFEMQVLDSAGKNRPDKHDCGALYDVLAPSENTMKPAHEWNTAVITCRNSFVTISLNGTRVVRCDLSKYTQAHKNIDGTDNKFDRPLAEWSHTGHIGMQAHGGATWYKNIKIREIQ